MNVCINVLGLETNKLIGIGGADFDAGSGSVEVNPGLPAMDEMPPLRETADSRC